MSLVVCDNLFVSFENVYVAQSVRSIELVFLHYVFDTITTSFTDTSYGTESETSVIPYEDRPSEVNHSETTPTRTTRRTKLPAWLLDYQL